MPSLILTNMKLFLLGFKPCFPVYTQEILLPGNSLSCHMRVKDCREHSFWKFCTCGHFCDPQPQGWGMFWYFHVWGEDVLDVFIFLSLAWWVLFPDVHMPAGFEGILEFALFPWCAQTLRKQQHSMVPALTVPSLSVQPCQSPAWPQQRFLYQIISLALRPMNMQ